MIVAHSQEGSAQDFFGKNPSQDLMLSNVDIGRRRWITGDCLGTAVILQELAILLLMVVAGRVGA